MHLTALYALFKGEFVPVHGTKACSGRSVIAELVLNLGIWWRRVVSCTAQLLYLRDKKLLYLLNGRLGGSWETLCTLQRRQILLPLPEIKFQIFQPVLPSDNYVFPYVYNLNVINCTSILHVCCSLHIFLVFWKF